MDSNELKAELNKQIERERTRDMVNEYIRIRNSLTGSGDLTFDEARSIALILCKANGVFDAPLRSFRP